MGGQADMLNKLYALVFMSLVRINLMAITIISTHYTESLLHKVEHDMMNDSTKYIRTRAQLQAIYLTQLQWIIQLIYTWAVKHGDT